MPFDSSGTFNRVIPGGWQADAAAGIKIRADRHDSEDDGFAVGLSTCITKDGRTQPTANIPMNDKRITNLAEPIDPKDATTKNYIDAKLGTVFTITGIDDEGRITFAGSQSPLATGEPLGISWTQSDLFFGVKPVGVETATDWYNRWVWNDKADGLGTDVMTLTEGGVGLPVLTLKSTDTGASAAPYLYLTRDSADPAVSDGLGALMFNGRNSVNQTKNYASISAVIGDPVVNTEDGLLYFNQIAAGAVTTRMYLNSAGATVVGTFDATGAASVGGTFYAAGAVTLGASLNVAADAYCGGSLATNGNFSAAGSITAVAGDVYSGSGRFVGSSVDGIVVGNNVSGPIFLRPNGPGSVLAQAVAYPTIFSVNANAQKPGGGLWIDSSDARIKNVLGDYEGGLEQIKGLRPVNFTFKGNDTREPPVEGSAPFPESHHYASALDVKQYTGLIAQEAQTAMPELVSSHEGYIDGAKTDVLNVDPTNLIYALVNAVKELSARLEALEG